MTSWELFLVKYVLGFVAPLIADEAKQFLAPPTLVMLVTEGRVLVGKMAAGAAHDALDMLVSSLATAWGIP